MRTATIAFSIVAHVVGACVLMIVQLFATDVLPEPRTATDFVLVTRATPPAPPPVRPIQHAAVVASPDAAPLTPPETIRPETPIDAVNDVRAIDTGVMSGAGSEALRVEPPPPPPPAITEPRRVGGDIRPPMRVTDAAPVYPPIARAAGVQGIVILEAMIGEDGAVRDVRILRSIPLLDDAAIAAVRRWRYTPTLLNGQPVPVVMTVTVAFKLR